MSGALRSRLPLAVTRQQKYVTACSTISSANGTFTETRLTEAQNLIKKIKNNIAEFDNLDILWVKLIANITDKTQRELEEKFYKEHAVTPSAEKIPYLQLVHDLEDMVADIQTEAEIIERNLKDSTVPVSTHVNSTPAATTTATTTTSSPATMIIMQSPETKKRPFTGNPIEYKSFIENWTKSVDATTSDGTKLDLLKQRLDGDAYNAIKLFNGDSGYKPALDKLKSRFGSVEDAIGELRKKIHFPFREKDNLAALRKNFDEFEYYITTIADYGEDPESSEWSGALLKKLPETVLLGVANAKRNLPPDTTFNVTQLRKSVSEILSDLERIEKITGKKSNKNTKPNYEKKVVAATTSEKDQKYLKKKPNQPKTCGLCENFHSSEDCPIAKNIDEAKKIAKEKRLCYKCFIPNHNSKKCRTKLKCKNCGARHHAINCRNPSGAEVKKLPKPEEDTTKFFFHQLSSDNATEKPEIMLLTSEAFISNPMRPEIKEKVLVFVDPGSQASLIFEDLATAMKLTKNKNPTNCEGSDGHIFELSASFSFDLHLVNGERRRITAFGTSNMLSELKVSKVPISKLMNQIWKNKPLPVKNGAPKLLLSMKEFNELVLNQETEELSNGFSLIHSKIGPMICGEGAVKRIRSRPTSSVVATFVKVSGQEQSEMEIPLDNVPQLNENLLLSDDEDEIIEEVQPPAEIVAANPEEVGVVPFAEPTIEIATEDSREKWVFEPFNDNISPRLKIALLAAEEFINEPSFLYNLELMGIKDDPNADENRLFKERFNETVCQKEDGAIYVDLPFMDKSGLGNNFNNCYRRLKCTSEKFLKYPDYARRYKGCVDEFVNSRFARQISLDLLNEPDSHLMPHCLVHCPGKTTPDRLVHDGSCKTERGISLNQCLLVGENRLPSLAGVMIRERNHRIITCSDVKKAFLQVYLHPASRKYVRFLFLKDVTKPISMDNLILLEFLVVPFGLVCSSNLLAHSIEYLLNKEAEITPKYAEWLQEVIKNNYVDNVTLGSESTEDAIVKNEYVREVFKKGKMDLRGQVSTDPAVNKHFKNEVKKFNFLGHELTIDTDSFIVGWKDSKLKAIPNTKKTLLSFCASLFDLMGLLEPVRLPIKLLIRDAWAQKLNWNSLLSQDILEKSKILYDERLNFTVPIKRKLFKTKSYSNVQLHIFGDASGQAFGIAAYLRYLDENNCYQTTLIFGKSRLAPLKPIMTIVKLELTATALANHVLEFLVEELKDVVEIKKHFIWTDSTTVLYWLKNAEGKGRFVINRIQKLNASKAEIRHVPGVENPSDLSSRGCSPEELLENQTMWFNGPAFLKYPEDLWPKHPNLDEEKEETVIVAAIKRTSKKNVIDKEEPFIDAKRLSNWRKLITAGSYSLKFIMLKSPKFCEKVFGKKSLDAFERRKKSEGLIMKQMQYAKELTEDYANKYDIYYENEIWKKYTRIKKLDDPIYLANCATSRLLILDIHELLNHGTVSMVLAEFNQKFFMSQARQVIKKVIRFRCMYCRKLNSVPFALPLMNDLEANRTHGKPFESIGVDLCGGFKLKGELTQHWIVVFTCFTTRSIHLEIVPSLSGEALIDALSRFAARRGMPSFIYSDNTTNFKIRIR